MLAALRDPARGPPCAGGGPAFHRAAPHAQQRGRQETEPRGERRREVGNVPGTGGIETSAPPFGTGRTLVEAEDRDIPGHAKRPVTVHREQRQGAVFDQRQRMPLRHRLHLADRPGETGEVGQVEGGGPRVVFLSTSSRSTSNFPPIR